MLPFNSLILLVLFVQYNIILLFLKSIKALFLIKKSFPSIIKLDKFFTTWISTSKFLLLILFFILVIPFALIGLLSAPNSCIALGIIVYSLVSNSCLIQHMFAPVSIVIGVNLSLNMAFMCNLQLLAKCPNLLQIWHTRRVMNSISSYLRIFLFNSSSVLFSNIPIHLNISGFRPFIIFLTISPCEICLSIRLHNDSTSLIPLNIFKSIQNIVIECESSAF
ncbi:hypothetical protein AGLY_000958 [Aphis glycines]|uniref:Uncharacterized protein n=1 Tax=Aphis glycines TaxID=307491 RepID=A0A6G0U8F5_APHGL|nr:hypothetical protein AGLY_000958 [Aphis glycines]